MADHVATTRFGADPANLGQAAAVLRARASAKGVPLRPADPADLAAAVIGADAWIALGRGASLAVPAAGGADAVEVLAAILCRAAGHGPLGEAEPARGSSDEALLTEAAAYLRWAVGHLGPELGREALRRAALDLCAAGPTSRFAAAAEVLAITAAASLSPA